jgi:hypothetical protein
MGDGGDLDAGTDGGGSSGMALKDRWMGRLGVDVSRSDAPTSFPGDVEQGDGQAAAASPVGSIDGQQSSAGAPTSFPGDVPQQSDQAAAASSTGSAGGQQSRDNAPTSFPGDVPQPEGQATAASGAGSGDGQQSREDAPTSFPGDVPPSTPAQGSGTVTIPEVTIVGDPDAGAAYNIGFADGKGGLPQHRNVFAGKPNLLTSYDEGFSDGTKAPPPELKLPDDRSDSVGPISPQDMEEGKKAFQEREEREKRIREELGEKDDPHGHEEEQDTDSTDPMERGEQLPVE